ncbi:GNAT family N-acetyltransferase [Salinactinospora qingdaonensis]|uniref:GNAT family N-acetyltransferase n=1 Tax=Salinactinospora qingdaonensis TaxID=702744 RepID=A0ABP7G1S7_9ACTN
MGSVSQVRVRRVGLADAVVRPMVEELLAEYTRRYGAAAAWREMAGGEAGEFAAPGGAVLVVEVAGAVVAGGAFRRVDGVTCEFKRIWTAAGQRRRGWGRRLMAELEAQAGAYGYRRVVLTTGPSQPEAVAMYEALGYELEAGVGVDASGVRRYYRFVKSLPGVGSLGS